MRSRFSLSCGPAPRRATAVAREQAAKPRRAPPRTPPRSPGSSGARSASDGSRATPPQTPQPRSPAAPACPPGAAGDADAGGYEELARRYAEALARREELRGEDRRLDIEIANAYRQQVAIEAEIRARARGAPAQASAQT
jgi:hypothetical protein